MTSGRITITLPDVESYSVEVEEGETLEVGRLAGVSEQRKLVLPLPEVSGKHAEIRCKSSGWRVVDWSSTNGTTLNLNGAGLTPGREYPLHTGDIIHIVQCNLQVFPPPATPVAEEEDPDQRYYRLLEQRKLE